MIRPYTYHLVSVILLAGVLCFAPLVWPQTRKAATEHDHSTHQHADICAGFVILPNGYAVLSAMAPGSTSRMSHGMHHGADADRAGQPHDGANKKDTGREQHAHPHGDMKRADHLMGYKHGDDIPTGKDMLCVPINDLASTSWTSVSASPDLHVTAKSAKGVLAHNSRANEALSFNIMRDGKPVERAEVRVIARMPLHDHRMPGGHGPANDPDVEGLEALPQGDGEYALSTIDFNMGGPWLFEVHIQAGDAIHKAYFASEIGEE